MRGGAVIGVGLGLVMALAGCAGASEAPSGVVATSASPTTPSPPTTTTADATVAQYASIVAKQQASMVKTLDDLLSDNCDWTTPGKVDRRPGYGSCGMQMMTANFAAQTLHLVLEGAQKPGAPAYIGTPPDEIKSIVADTMTAADTLVNASENAKSCTNTPAPADCPKSLFEVFRAMTGMQAQFAAWGPYGV